MEIPSFSEASELQRAVEKHDVKRWKHKCLPQEDIPNTAKSSKSRSVHAERLSSIGLPLTARLLGFLVSGIGESQHGELGKVQVM